MSAMKKGLGRGFESLIPTDLLDDSFDPTVKQDKKVSTLQVLPLTQVHADPHQPRRMFDKEALDELAESIKEHGVLQPIVVISHDGGYQIVAGERRYRASKLAGLTEIPAIIRTMTGQHQLEVSLIENIQRRDLNSIETATAYAKLRDQFNLTTEQISKRVHKSPSAVSNTMRLLKLPKEVLVALAESQLTEGQARPLIGHDETLILEILPRIIAESWSARKVEQYIVDYKKTPMEQVEKQPTEYDNQAEVLTTRLGSKVAIRVNAKGSGRISIDFKNAEQLKKIQSLLQSEN